jgi:HEAT repeat protein
MSLFQLEREGDTEKIVEILETTDNPDIRVRAAEILGDLAENNDREELDRTREVVDTLVATACADDDDDVRAAAIDALDKYGQSALEQLIAELTGQELGTSADWTTARAFADVLEADQPELRMAAATGLGRIGDRSATPAVVDRLADDDPRVRARAAVACGRLEDPRAVEALERRVTDEYTDVRQAAADALGKIGTDPALEILLAYAADDSESVRRTVADALGYFGSIEPVDTLVEALEDEYEVVRRTAMFSLVEILSNAPTEQSHRVREATADKLESATAADVIPPLAEILTESTGTPQRRNAAWLLGRVAERQHREEAQAALVDALGDDDGMTAQFAATSLAQLGGDGLETELLELVESEASTETKSKALFVLGKVGGETARTELADFVDQTDDETLREAAFSALSKLGGIETGDLS